VWIAIARQIFFGLENATACFALDRDPIKLNWITVQIC
jgi:hypothetical protein